MHVINKRVLITRLTRTKEHHKKYHSLKHRKRIPSIRLNSKGMACYHKNYWVSPVSMQFLVTAANVMLARQRGMYLPGFRSIYEP